MHQPFESVREELLSAGIAPRHVNRYITELREHLADLAARERATGMDARQANERALALLGEDRQLAQAMIEKGATRSLAARAPWSVFAVLPVVALLAVLGVTFFAMFQLLWPVRDLAFADMSSGYKALIALASFRHQLRGRPADRGRVYHNGIATAPELKLGVDWPGTGGADQCSTRLAHAFHCVRQWPDTDHLFRNRSRPSERSRECRGDTEHCNVAGCVAVHGGGHRLSRPAIQTHTSSRVDPFRPCRELELQWGV